MPRRSGGTSIRRRADSVFVGRQTELEHLEARVEDLCAGSGGTVLVTGPPGTGKSALLDQVDGRARARGVRVVRLAAVELRCGAAFSFARPLAATPAGAPLLVLADNLDWADAESTRLLYGHDRESAPEPRLLVAAMQPHHQLATACPAAGVTPHPWSEYPTALRLVLGPLSEAETAACVQRYAPGASRRLERSLLDHSGGSPLCLTEMLVSLAVLDLGRVGAFPDTLGAIIESRMTALPAEVSQGLRTAAVLGASFTPEELSALLPVRPAVVREWLARATDADLLDRRRVGRFVHALFAEYLESTLEPEHRLELHVRVARTVATSPAERVRHLAAATPLIGGDALGSAAYAAVCDARRLGHDAYAAQIAAIAGDALARLSDDATRKRWLSELAAVREPP